MNGPPPSSPAVAVNDWKEYYFLQDLVTGFNADCLEIKKWSVALASIVAVVGQSGLTNLKPMLVVIILLALAFWVTETVWRMNQWAFIRSIREIEAAGGGCPTISTRWARYYIGSAATRVIREDVADERGESGFGRIVNNFVAGRTSMPHALIIAAAVFFLFDPMHVLPTASPQTKPQEVVGKLDVHLVPPPPQVPPGKQQ